MMVHETENEEIEDDETNDKHTTMRWMRMRMEILKFMKKELKTWIVQLQMTMILRICSIFLYLHRILSLCHHISSL